MGTKRTLRMVAGTVLVCVIAGCASAPTVTERFQGRQEYVPDHTWRHTRFHLEVDVDAKAMLMATAKDEFQGDLWEADSFQVVKEQIRNDDLFAQVMADVVTGGWLIPVRLAGCKNGQKVDPTLVCGGLYDRKLHREETEDRRNAMATGRTTTRSVPAQGARLWLHCGAINGSEGWRRELRGNPGTIDVDHAVRSNRSCRRQFETASVVAERGTDVEVVLLIELLELTSWTSRIPTLHAAYVERFQALANERGFPKVRVTGQIDAATTAVMGIYRLRCGREVSAEDVPHVVLSAIWEPCTFLAGRGGAPRLPDNAKLNEPAHRWLEYLEAGLYLDKTGKLQRLVASTGVRPTLVDDQVVLDGTRSDVEQAWSESVRTPVQIQGTSRGD